MEADAHVATIRALSGSGMLGSFLGMARSRLRSPLRYILLVPSLRDRAIFSGLFVSSKTSSSGPSVIHESGYCGMPLQPVIVFIEGAEFRDDENDYRFPVWAGVLPLEVRSRAPAPDDNLVQGVPFPEYVLRYDARLEGRACRLSDRLTGGVADK